MWEGAVGGQHGEAPKGVQGVGPRSGAKPLTGVDGLKRNGTDGTEDGCQNTIDSVAFANTEVMRWLNDLSFKAPIDPSTFLPPPPSSSTPSTIASPSPLYRRGTLRSLPAPECRETPSVISTAVEKDPSALEPHAKRRKR